MHTWITTTEHKAFGGIVMIQIKGPHQNMLAVSTLIVLYMLLHGLACNS